MQRTSADVDYSQKYEDCFTSSCIESMKSQKEKGHGVESSANIPEAKNLVPGSLRQKALQRKMAEEQRASNAAKGAERVSKASYPEESYHSQNDCQLQQSIHEAIVESQTPDFEQHRPSKVETNVEESVPEQIEVDKQAISVSGFHANKTDQKEQSIHEQIEIEASKSKQLSKLQHLTQERDDHTSKMNTIENEFEDNIQNVQ